MCSPEREGPLLVPAHAVPVDGRGAWHRIQMVGAIGQGGHPLIVPLCFLFPEKTWEIRPLSLQAQYHVSSHSQQSTTAPLQRSRPQWELPCTPDSVGFYSLGSYQHLLGGTQAKVRVQRGPNMSEQPPAQCMSRKLTCYVLAMAPQKHCPFCGERAQGGGFPEEWSLEH